MVARRGSGNGCATKPSRLVSVLMLLLTIGAQTPTSQANTASSANCTGSDGCDDSTTSFSSCPEPDFVGDGDCDGGNNIPECDYDGGDCCECTCTNGEFECGYTGYDCVDPAGADCSTNTDGGGISSTSTSTPGYGSTSPFPDCTGDPQLVGDGDCDEDNNNEDCEWDGGDCCECTCIDAEHTCGVDTPFNCLDPSAACDDTSTTINASSSTTVNSSSTSSAAASVNIPTPAPVSVTSPSTSSDSFTDSPVGSTNGSMSSTEDESIPLGTTPPTPTTTAGWEGVTHSPSAYDDTEFVGGSPNSAPGSSRGRAGAVIGGAAAVIVMVASSWWTF